MQLTKESAKAPRLTCAGGWVGLAVCGDAPLHQRGHHHSPHTLFRHLPLPQLNKSMQTVQGGGVALLRQRRDEGGVKTGGDVCA